MTDERRAHRDDRVVATFREEGQARRAAEEAGRAGADHVDVGDRGDRARVARAEMQQEAAETWPVPFSHVSTKEQTRGAVAGAAVGSLLGALVGALLAFVVDVGPLAIGGRIAVLVAIGVATGGTVGFTAGGGLRPRMDDGSAEDPTSHTHDPMSAERGTTVGVESHDEDQRRRAEQAVRSQGAERVDRVHEEGRGGGGRRAG